MYKRLLISEQEKNDIKKLYSINEDEERNPLLMMLLQKALDNSNKETNISTDIKSTDSKVDSDTNKELEDTKNLTTGDVKLEGNFNSDQESIIKMTIDEMNKSGITDPLAQIGILSVIDKESGFRAFKEIGYGGTSDSRIESIFGNRGKKCKHLKKSDPDFFDCVYGYKSGMRLGNDQPGDGWKYIGRGLNGITGKSNYRKYGNMIGVDLVGNPKLAEDPRIAAKIAIAFFTKGKSPSSFPKFNSKEDAVNYFADLNAGRRGSSFGRGAAIASSKKFGLDTSNLA